MVEQTRTIPVKFRLGDPIIEDGQPKKDENGKVVRGEPVATKTVEVKNLTAEEAWDADDFALAVSPTGDPSRDNRTRTFSLCAVRMIDKETIMRPRTLDDFTRLRGRFQPEELMQLARGYVAYASELNQHDDPKDSSCESAS
jgi:hypothetical protein